MPINLIKKIFLLLALFALIAGCGEQAKEETPPEDATPPAGNTPPQDNGSPTDDPTPPENTPPSENSPPQENEPPLENNPPPAVQCDTHLSYFSDEMWPILNQQCFTCHEIDKVTSDLNLVGETISDFNQINFQNAKSVAAKKDNNGVSLLLTKPTNANTDHSGGLRFEADSAEYQIFNEFVSLVSSCVEDVPSGSGLLLDDASQRLRKMTLALGGRLPKSFEESSMNSVANDDEQLQTTLDSIADQLMMEDAFFIRMKEIYNDQLLLDAFPDRRAISSFSLTNFVNDDYFDDSELQKQTEYQGDENRATRVAIRRHANRGLAHAPLELIAHVIKNDRSITEILTADYVLVNPYTAALFSALVNNDPSFNFQYGDTPEQHDPNDFREAVLTDNNNNEYPHAGILTTLTFLTRYPSTNTNRNRARSRYVYSYFLDTDVQGLADRAGLDLDNVVGDIPTLQDPQCKACHDTVDPVAGLFKNWTNNGRYRGDFPNWFSERNTPQMLKPGFSIDVSDQLPTGNSANALQWLAQRIVNDSRFATVTVKTIYKGITGQPVPADNNFVESLKTTLVENGYNVKQLIKSIIRSNSFTANNLSADESPDDFADIGMGRLLLPEQLHRKIQAVTQGYTWSSPTNRNLMDVNTYRLLYGGIDSVNVTERTTAPTSIMTNIQERIATQSSCNIVPQDFNKDIIDRVLFPIAEITDTPDTELGKLKIKQNIQFLHKHLLGEELALSDPEIDRTYQLFESVRLLTPDGSIPADCDTGLNSGNPVRVDANKTVRTWMAVVTYLFMDYKFLHE